MRNYVSVIVALLALPAAAEPIKTHPSNPHYLMYKGKPIVLVTSAEHYGGVINRDFDYVQYFDELKSYGLNYTRIYPGAMLEPMGKFLAGNTLGPKPRSLLVPWARSGTPGYLNGGNKFDLDRWDAEYFRRLRDFIAQARDRDIIVEICFFNSQYSDSWPISPLYHENNVQGVGTGDWREAQTLKSPPLVRRYDDYVRKITQEVNGFDNVILEICDEPGHIGTGGELAGPWVSHLLDTVVEAERGLPGKHLVAQEVELPLAGPLDFAADPRLALIVAQYIWGREGGEMGGMRGLDFKYDLNKPIELNETDYYPRSYRGDKIAASRVEAWEFMVGGGAAFNHLNSLYTVENPRGRGADNPQILRALASLKAFLESFEFIRMRQDKDLVAAGLSGQDVFWRAISEPGRQYALYIHHSSHVKAGSYLVIPGKYLEKLSLRFASGRYRADWVNPADGVVIASETFQHEGGTRTITTPPYAVDIALRVLLVNSQPADTTIEKYRAPYPRSTHIAGVTFDDASARTLAPGSDIWPITWAANGHLYTAWGDGGGFGGTNTDGRVSLGIGRVEGDKDGYRGINIAGGKDAPHAAPFPGKSEGILALGDTLYLWRDGKGSDQANFSSSELYRSDDAGATWRSTGVSFSKKGGAFDAGDEGFFALAFCQFGRGYAGARDRYAYLYAPEVIDPTHWNLRKPGRVDLLRVPKDRLEQRPAYEFFAGLDSAGMPQWTASVALRKPVWEDPVNGTQRMAVSYNPGLKRYLLTNVTVNRLGWMTIHDAPEPWGPWTLAHVEYNPKRWGTWTILFTFVNKWLSPDGRHFVLVHTKNDTWSTIGGTFLVR